MTYDLTAAEEGPNSDVAWFRKHADRNFRIRLASPGEFGVIISPIPSDAREYAIVQQLRPGHRRRFPAIMRGEPGTSERAVETLLALLREHEPAHSASRKRAKKGRRHV